MTTLTDQLLVICLLLNFAVVGTSRLGFSVRAVALQGGLLGVLPLLVHPFSLHLLAMAAGIIAVKAVLIPFLIGRAIRKAEIQREFEPFIGYIPSLVLGAIFTAVAFVFAEKLPLSPEHEGLLFVPASIATLMCGFLILMGRRKAISQVIGYLLLENGIFIFGLLLAEAMPAMVEAGALLDLLVGIFVMGIVINHISREFSSLDTSRLSALRED